MREWRLSIRDGAALGTAVGFYGLVIVVLPFGIGPDRGLLQSVAPGMIWIATVLAALLSVDRLFAADHRAGLLDVISMGDVPLEVVVTVKTLVHWATTVVPL
ncbi:MAG: heme exporter protein CcmB, partial [Pseudomonadota bacterium]